MDQNTDPASGVPRKIEVEEKRLRQMKEKKGKRNGKRIVGNVDEVRHIVSH